MVIMKKIVYDTMTLIPNNQDLYKSDKISYLYIYKPIKEQHSSCRYIFIYIHCIVHNSSAHLAY